MGEEEVAYSSMQFVTDVEALVDKMRDAGYDDDAIEEELENVITDLRDGAGV